EAQKNFYSRENLSALKLLRKEAAEPAKLDRLMRVYHDTLGYSIVRRAEEAKIALADSSEYRTAIQVASELVEVDISVEQMVEAIDAPKAKMIELVKEAIQQGQKTPDVIYMTGGSARSPILRQAVEQAVPNVPIVSGNYFGSVTAGLARWAETCFK
ncbi:molecular chaperone, partial [Vibrio fortis]